MIFALITLVVAFSLALSQTYITFAHTADEDPVGLNIFGVPFEAVLALVLLPLGHFVFTAERQTIMEAIGLGAACVYLNTWGRTVAFVAVARRKAKNADPASADE